MDSFEGTSTLPQAPSPPVETVTPASPCLRNPTPPTLTSPGSLKGQQVAASGTAGLQDDEEGEVSEGAESPGRRRERRGPAVSWVRRGRSPGHPKVTPSRLWFCVPRFLFFASPVFWAERTVILPADFLLLHPSVLQCVLGGRNHGAEL